MYVAPFLMCVRGTNMKSETQYGNILRHIPQGDSPLLLPANEHKQLAVIDFEYANANVRGLEFANHFVSLTPEFIQVLKLSAMNKTSFSFKKG